MNQRRGFALLNFVFIFCKAVKTENGSFYVGRKVFFGLGFSIIDNLFVIFLAK
ncbi:MAG: hypothetical protein PWK00_06630 [Coxiella burnetii]|nr:hypothetical protein [Coxiella burnetii]